VKPAALSGRDSELRTLLDIVRRGVGGTPQAVVVRGESGVGKTTLVRAVVDEVRADGAQLLWGQGLRFGAVEAAYHPLVLALEGWLRSAGEAERTRLLDEIPAAARVLPSLGAPPPESPAPLMTVVDALIGRIVARSPTMLVVDDVQWADPSTWDALTYLVAGFGEQSLALLATQREDGVRDERFQHWLDGLRRLPGTHALDVGRLDREGTERQLTALMEGEPPPGLLEEVFARSQGNPYFTELLVRQAGTRGVDGADALPDELRRALLDSWQALDPGTRAMTRVLAVAGRPTPVATLSAVAADLGLPATEGLREAVDARVTVLEGDLLWFRHPLLAEVLVETYLPGEAGPVHAAWAGLLAGTTGEGVDELRRLGDLATHQELAGAHPEAFATLLRAADVALELRVRHEAADFLSRAVALWETGSPDRDDLDAEVRLLERAGRVCERAGRKQDAWRLIGRARERLDETREPLWAAKLRMTHEDLSWELGLIESIGQDITDDVVRLTLADPDSSEHVDALTWTAENLYWSGRPEEAAVAAGVAVEAAERVGSGAALALAYATRAMMTLGADLVQAARDAETARAHAEASGDPDLMELVFLAGWWVHQTSGDLDVLVGYVQEWLDLDRSVGGAGWEWPRQVLSQLLLDRGDLVGLDAQVRSALARADSAYFEVTARLAAAVLAVRRGALDAAEQHRVRAYEVMPFLEDRRGVDAGPLLTEILVALGRPDEALALVERTLPINTGDPATMDAMLIGAARAVAELVQRATDDRDPDAVRSHRQSLDRLLETRAGLPGTPFEPVEDRDRVARARGALFLAEVGRVHDEDDRVDRWREAVRAAETAGMRWEQHRAAVRLAAALVESGTGRDEAARMMRSAHAYAAEQRAAPLAVAVEELAGLARISLAAPVEAPAVSRAFAGLTAREVEVLGHLVADRTYAEIAAELFISEKTVSVHVSNLLRKTETSSRREVAALARRLGWSAEG
jgi:DNA-binding CsgD family transcriptional regulator/tetratricopeptide (TPR) repeat protein